MLINIYKDYVDLDMSKIILYFATICMITNHIHVLVYHYKKKYKNQFIHLMISVNHMILMLNIHFYFNHLFKVTLIVYINYLINILKLNYYKLVMMFKI
jgi:hypothetical protein